MCVVDFFQTLKSLTRHNEEENADFIEQLWVFSSRQLQPLSSGIRIIYPLNYTTFLSFC